MWWIFYYLIVYYIEKIRHFWYQIAVFSSNQRKDKFCQFRKNASFSRIFSLVTGWYWIKVLKVIEIGYWFSPEGKNKYQISIWRNFFCFLEPASNDLTEFCFAKRFDEFFVIWIKANLVTQKSITILDTS